MPRVQDKGQVTLEADLRDEVGIRPGDDVQEVVLRSGEAAPFAGILVAPKRGGIARFRGLLARGGSTDETLKEIRG